MVLNPFLMNDWKLKAALKVVFVLLLTVWALVGLDVLGVHLPLLRGIFSVAFFLFIPGILILRALRAHRIGSERTLLFAVGLSIATLMFLGFFMNVVYPVLGIAQPLTTLPVIGTMSAVTVLLAAVSYWRDRDFVGDVTTDLNRVLIPPILLLCIIPFIMVLAVYAMNAYHTNIPLLCVLVIIGATAFWLCTSASFPKAWYPLAVFTIALAMLYFGSLLSPYVWGWDIQKELYHANLVLTNGAWNASLPESTNSVISVTLLAPMLSLTSGVSVTWLFKIVYPLVFALVPLGLFVAFRSQTNDRIAFLGAFFVSSLFTFYGELPALARQEVAELFLVLLLILTVDKFQSVAEKRRVYVLYAVFAVSLIVSHYALAFIYLIYITIAWLLLFLVDNPALRRLQRKGRGQSTGELTKPQRMVTLFFVLSFAAFTGVWYVSIGSAATASIGHVIGLVFSIILATQTIGIVIGVGVALYLSALALVYIVVARRQRETTTPPQFHGSAPFVLLGALTISGVAYRSASLNDLLQIGTLSPLHEVGFLLYIFSTLLIAVGLGTFALRRCRRGFDVEFVALALASFAFFVVAVIVPPLAFSINTTRLFHISTLLLAPFCVVGGLFIIWAVEHVVHKFHESTHADFALRAVAALFVVFFLFSTGFVYEVTQQQSTSFILNSHVDAPQFNEREVIAGQWLNAVRSSDAVLGHFLPIYADAHRRVLFDSLDLDHPAIEFPSWPPRTPANAYIFLGTFNVESGRVAQVQTTTILQGTVMSYANLGSTKDNRSKIFDDGGAAVYYSGAI